VPDASRVADDDVLQRLKEMLLSAVLLRRPLPGSDRPLILPDLDFVLRQPNVILSNENLTGRLSVEGGPKPLQILSPEEVRAKAGSEGDLAYLRFRPPLRKDAVIRITLEASIAARDPERLTLGLSGVQVDFHEVDGEWEVAGEPAFFAG
jgi:hypothetical protein